MFFSYQEMMGWKKKGYIMVWNIKNKYKINGFSGFYFVKILKCQNIGSIFYN